MDLVVRCPEVVTLKVDGVVERVKSRIVLKNPVKLFTPERLVLWCGGRFPSVSQREVLYNHRDVGRDPKFDRLMPQLKPLGRVVPGNLLKNFHN